MTELTSRPDHSTPFMEGDPKVPGLLYQLFFDEVFQKLNERLLGNQIQLEVYTVTTLPAVPDVSIMGLIGVSNETGGAVPAFSDGTSWRRVTDRAIVS